MSQDRVFRQPRLTWSPIDSIAAGVVTLAAGATRLAGVTSTGTVFDEGYYVADACLAAFGPGPPCHEAGSPRVAPVHPPLGPSLIGIGIRLFGDRPGGWRVAPLAAGTLTVLLTYVLARALLGSTFGATVASGALAVDFLHLVHSRVAMLDVFVTMFGVATVLALVVDRAWIARDRRWWARPWRIVAGVMGGAAAATKWPGVAFLVLALVVTVLWDRRAGRSAGRSPRIGPLVLSGLGYFALMPALVYVASYVGSAEGRILASPWSEASWLHDVLAEQWRMLRFHDRLDAQHVYASPPWSWPLLKRPIVYFYEPAGIQYRLIVAMGNPVAWAASVVSLLWALAIWLRRRGGGAEGPIIAAVAFTWLPWFAVDLVRDPVFLFYLLPAVPFMCLALGWAATRLGRGAAGRAVLASVGAGAIAALLFFLPLLRAQPISVDAWRDRIWFSDCDLRGITLSDIDLGPLETPADLPGPYPEALLRLGAPPNGWCWI